MRLRIYYCPACGYSLKVEERTSSLTCPVCGSTIMVEQEEGAENKDRNTIITDTTR